jgi:flagellar P-ring protein precursor FlgI
VTFVLNDPDPETAQRVAASINGRFGAAARVRDSAAVEIAVSAAGGDPNRLAAVVGDLGVTPDTPARVVINERTGTVVAGGDVQISGVVVSQGDIKVTVTGERYAMEGGGYPASMGRSGNAGLGGLVVTNTKLDVDEGRDAVRRFPAATVGDLVEGLSQLKVDTRGVIAVLQAVKAAGALHAELIVQ